MTLEWIVSSSVLLLLLIGLRFLLKGRVSLRLQYGLWLLALVRLLLPFSLGSTPVSVLNTLPQDAPARMAERAEALSAPRGAYTVPETTKPADAPAVPTETVRPQTGQETAEAPATGGAGTARSGIIWDRLARYVWLAGAGLVGLWLLLGNLRFALRLKRSRRPFKDFSGEAPCHPERERRIFQILRRFTPQNDRLPIYVSEAVETPCLFGLFRPAVYLTPEAAGDEARLKHVLAHEETHFRHGDHIWSILRGLCLALHWFNPLVWWAAFLSRRDGELACDEAAIRRLGEGERAAYGRTLIGLTCEKRPALLLTATTMTGSRRGIKERIILLAKKPKTAAITLVALLLILAVAAGCTLTGRSAAAKEPDFRAMAWEVAEVYVADRGITGLSETEYALWQEETGRYVDVVFPIGDGEQSVQVRFVKDEAGDWNMHVTTVTGAHSWSWQEEVYGDTPPAEESDEPSHLPETPAEALALFFTGEEAPSLGLTWEGDENTVTEYSRYALTDWYEGRFDVLLGGWRWENCELPDTEALKEEAAYWLTLGSADGNALLRLYPQNGGTLVYSVGKELTLQMSGGPGGVPVAKNTAYRDGTPLAAWRVADAEGEGSILDDLRAEYDLLQVDLLSWHVTMGGDGAKDADAAVKAFLDDVGTWFTNLEPLNGYSLLDYELVRSEINELSADGSAVLGSFLLAGNPKYPDSPFIWAGNAPGEGAYEGKVMIGREFVLQRVEKDTWRCTDIGTGGVRLREKLLGQTKPDNVNGIVYTMNLGDHYTLTRGSEGFDEALEKLLSLQGFPCEEPDKLVSRSFELDTGARITLTFDGERVYGRWLTNHWLVLDVEGRVDQMLTNIFLRFGESETSSLTSPSGYRGMPEDEGITLKTEYAAYDLPALLSAMEAYRDAYRENGRQVDEELKEVFVMVRLENHSENTIHFGNNVELEAFRDGEWRYIPMRDGYGIFGVGLSLDPEETYDSLWISPFCYYDEALSPGRYRACLSYGFRGEQAENHVAFAEFEFVESLTYVPEPVVSAAEQYPAAASALIPEIDWSAFARVAGDGAALKLMDDLENWCLGIPISSTVAFEAERRNRLYFFMNSTGGLDGAYTDHFASVLGELYDAAPKNFARVVLEELDEYHRSETLNLLAYALACEPREALALLEAELEN